MNPGYYPSFKQLSYLFIPLGLSPMKNSLLSSAHNYQNNTVRSSVTTAGTGGGLMGIDKRASI